MDGDGGTGRDPATGLRAVAALHRLAERLEELQVQNARDQGWSKTDIASALGVRLSRSKRAGRVATGSDRRT